MNSDEWPTCEICGDTRPEYNTLGQQMMREFEGTMLCINHYSQAKWPETYIEIVDEVQELIA